MSETVVATELGRAWGRLAGASMVVTLVAAFLSLPVRGAVSLRGPAPARCRSGLGRAAALGGAAPLGGAGLVGGAGVLGGAGLLAGAGGLGAAGRLAGAGGPGAAGGLAGGVSPPAATAGWAGR